MTPENLAEMSRENAPAAESCSEQREEQPGLPGTRGQFSSDRGYLAKGLGGPVSSLR